MATAAKISTLNMLFTWGNKEPYQTTSSLTLCERETAMWGVSSLLVSISVVIKTPQGSELARSIADKSGNGKEIELIRSKRVVAISQELQQLQLHTASIARRTSPHSLILYLQVTCCRLPREGKGKAWHQLPFTICGLWHLYGRTQICRHLCGCYSSRLSLSVISSDNSKFAIL